MRATLADAGIAVTVLPATDLFLMGRDADHNVPRGVTPRRSPGCSTASRCSLATNNVLNPFTPFGDGSLLRMANLYANIAQLGRPEDFERCLDMITGAAAKLMNLKGYGVSVGNRADLIVLPCTSGRSAIAEIVRPLFEIQARTCALSPTRLARCTRQPDSEGWPATALDIPRSSPARRGRRGWRAG